jgi:hypothetical protein
MIAAERFVASIFSGANGINTRNAIDFPRV